MVNPHSTVKHGWIFYPLIFLIFIWPYTWQTNILLTFGAWRFLLATLAIIVCATLFFKKTWISILGFPQTARQIIACVLTAILAFLIFYIIINFTLSEGGYKLQAFNVGRSSEYFGRYPLLSWTFLRFSQPLNEEIILRAILLGFFARFFTHRIFLAVIAALIFSGLHLLFYYAGPMAVQLDTMTLLTLFFFALAANSFYLTFNHIGFGFAIHLAWNWWRFSGDIIKDGVVLNEAQTFNIIEGSMPVFIFVSSLSLFCVIGMVIHEFKIGRRPV